MRSPKAPIHTPQTVGVVRISRYGIFSISSGSFEIACFPSLINSTSAREIQGWSSGKENFLARKRGFGVRLSNCGCTTLQNCLTVTAREAASFLFSTYLGYYRKEVPRRRKTVGRLPNGSNKWLPTPMKTHIAGKSPVLSYSQKTHFSR